jgi:hypothetical protein
MDNYNKFFGLFALIIGGFLGFVLVVVGIFYLLKVCSIVMFNIPGFDVLYQVIIVVIPYIIYYCAYYYLIKKINKSTSLVSRGIARLLIATGLIIATTTLVLAIMDHLKVNKEWLRVLASNSHYAFIIQIILLFAIAAVLASGDAKEKDWMEKNT